MIKNNKNTSKDTTNHKKSHLCHPQAEQLDPNACFAQPIYAFLHQLPVQRRALSHGRRKPHVRVRCRSQIPIPCFNAIHIFVCKPGHIFAVQNKVIATKTTKNTHKNKLELQNQATTMFKHTINTNLSKGLHLTHSLPHFDFQYLQLHRELASPPKPCLFLAQVGAAHRYRQSA
jgi:hypothetical protein